MRRRYASRRTRPRKFRRRNFAKKKSRTTVRIPRGVGPVAPRTIVRMKYAGQQLISTGVVPAHYIFNLNSLYDPDRSGTGHQPYGFDTYTTLYNRYRVFAMSYRIELVSPGSTAQQLIVGATNHAASLTNAELASESPGFRTKWAQGGVKSALITGKVYLPKLAGQTSAQYKAGEKYAATISGSPSELMCLHVVLKDAGVAGITACNLSVVLMYHAEWFDPVELSQS